MANSSLHTWLYKEPADKAKAEYAAVLVSVEKNRNSGSIILTREWPDMDATAAEAFAFDTAASGDFGSLAEVSLFENPKADQKTYTGDFYGHRPEIISQPGRAVTVRQVLTLPITGAGKGSALKATWLESDTVQHDVYYYFDNTVTQYTAATDEWDTTTETTDGLAVNVGRVSFNANGSLNFIIETITESVGYWGDDNFPDADEDHTGAEYKTWLAPWGTASLKRVTNATEANLNFDLNGLTASFSNAVDIRKNANGLFDYSIRKTPRPVTAGAVPDAMSFAGSTYSYRGMYGGVEKTFTVTISWWANAGDAGTAIGAVSTTVAGYGTNRTGIVESHGRFKATKVTISA